MKYITVFIHLLCIGLTVGLYFITEHPFLMYVMPVYLAIGILVSTLFKPPFIARHKLSTYQNFNTKQHLDLISCYLFGPIKLVSIIRDSRKIFT
jgi:membrane protein YdbS with pleckstrin-like domain